MTKISDALTYGLTIRESANDGSDFTNPAADYRRLFLGEDGQLHVRDSAGTVTAIGAASGSVATDAIWDAAGDLAVGSGADTAAKLTKGSDGEVLTMVAGAVDWANAPQCGVVKLTTGDLTTTSNTFTDATGLTVTLTTGAHRCLVTFFGTCFTNADGINTAFDLDIDGTNVGGTYGILHIYQDTALAANNVPVSFTFLTDVLTAASHTFHIEWRNDGAGATTSKLYASATNPAIFQVMETALTA